VGIHAGAQDLAERQVLSFLPFRPYSPDIDASIALASHPDESAVRSAPCRPTTENECRASSLPKLVCSSETTASSVQLKALFFRSGSFRIARILRAASHCNFDAERWRDCAGRRPTRAGMAVAPLQSSRSRAVLKSAPLGQITTPRTASLRPRVLGRGFCPTAGGSERPMQDCPQRRSRSLLGHRLPAFRSGLAALVGSRCSSPPPDLSMARPLRWRAE
jgi:hypothetical protein